jgi:hypothetical protein
MASSRYEKPTKSASSIQDFPCKWAPSDFNSFLADYHISPSWHPVLPNSDRHAFNPPKSKISLYADFFKSANFSLLISRFCLHVLEVHQLRLSQIHPLGLAKNNHFDFVMRSLKRSPSTHMFLGFFTVNRKGESYSFDKRDPKRNVVAKNPSSVRKMVFRRGDEDLADLQPLKRTLRDPLYKWLCDHPTDMQPLLEHASVALGMSRRWEKLLFQPSYMHSHAGALPTSFLPLSFLE